MYQADLLYKRILADSRFNANVRQIIRLSQYFRLKKPVISSGFGMRKHPVYKVRKFHTGIDIPNKEVLPVYATNNR